MVIYPPVYGPALYDVANPSNLYIPNPKKTRDVFLHPQVFGRPSIDAESSSRCGRLQCYSRRLAESLVSPTVSSTILVLILT